MVVITTLNIVVVLMAYLARIEKHRYLLAWAFILLAFVLGIRYGYGNDFFAYKYMFDHGYPDAGYADDVEPGWFFINKLFRPFGFSAFVFILTAVEHILLYNLIHRYVPPQYYWLAVFIYVFNTGYMLIGSSMMRQFLVQILGIYAMGYAIKKRIIPFLIIILLGFTIHKVALLLLPLYFIPYIKTPRWWAFLIILVVFYFVLNNMGRIIDQIVVLIQHTDMKYADSYLNDQVLGGEYKLGIKNILPFIIYFIFFARNIKNLPIENQAYSWMVVFSLFIVPFGLMFPMALRLVWVYSFAEIIVLPLLIYNERLPFLKYTLLMLYIVSLLLQYKAFFSSETYGPYFTNFKTLFFS